ncbi:hypothetical protein [Stakelama saccharophila]|uniref:Uncharacterized protein n=1 Tax=Stakelama saccharophila TaxID=3075605 RepID=A0ABZ0B5D4_9SPHN|nr:hypothetical protein [Stakelama sp. W311]WNO52596.1 hypothetical protein RPR59_08930 [Stakelama sp. W311]
MLAGLIFAMEEAEDRPEMLAATLPFGGMTLLEYQARLLITAGVGHILVAVGRVTPALLGAVSRIGKGDVTVDIVRSAEEGVARVHPLASVIVVADGLVTTDVAVQQMAGEAADSLMVIDDEEVPASVERVDAQHCWAGIATLAAQRLADIAAMPREYDFQSTLLRVSVQAGARHVKLPPSAKKAGHGIERNREALASRSNAVLAAMANQRIGWADRYVFTPITRQALPLMVRRNVSNWAVIAAGTLLSLAAIILFGFRLPPIALSVALLAVACLSSGSLLSWLRAEDRWARWQEAAIVALAAVSIALTGADQVLRTGEPSPGILAAMLIVTAGLADRVPVRRRPWFGNAPSYLLLVTPFAIAGVATIGLGVLCLYALATLAFSIEAVREKA